jgi:hypothetical protein
MAKSAQRAAVGEMLIQAADEMTEHQKLTEGGDSCGSSEENPAKG